MDTATPASASSRFRFPARDAAPSGETRLDASAVFADIDGLAEVVVDLPRLDGLVVSFVAEFSAGECGFGFVGFHRIDI
jgi:hypothetical protein